MDDSSTADGGDMVNYSAFSNLLENKEMVRVLDVLLRDSYVYLEVEDITRRAKVTTEEAERSLQMLKRIGLLDVKKDSSSNIGYKIDKSNEIIDSLETAQTRLVKHTKEILKEKEKID